MPTNPAGIKPGHLNTSIFMESDVMEIADRYGGVESYWGFLVATQTRDHGQALNRFLCNSLRTLA